MVKVPNKIKRMIDNYLSLLKENNIPIKNAYLFGSYAKGHSNEWSDIDLAIVSDFFEGIRIKDKIRRLTLSVSSSLEILPFNTNDFTQDNPLAKEIMDSGIKLV